MKGRDLCELLAIALVLVACGGGTSPTSPTPPAGGMSATARTYLNQVLDVMQSQSINRKTIDWARFRTAVEAVAPAAQTIVDLYPAIRTALGLLDDHHSLYQGPDGTIVPNPSPLGACPDATTPVAVVPAQVGYVKVGGFLGSGAAATAFAQGIQDAVRTADRPELLGWVVDLRDNGGGTMWPMIAGLGPVLGDGNAGAFIDPDGAITWWGYRDNASISNGAPMVTVSSSYRVFRPNPRVAVLTNCRVASSGEATVIAFRERADTRSFGTATYGVSTANRTISLTGGGSLMLTVATMADRTGRLYGSAVIPDELIADPAETVRRALEWVRAGAALPRAGLHLPAGFNATGVRPTMPLESPSSR